jgi:predicted DNA-binding protein
VGHTITVRLTKELAEWLEETAAKSGRAQGQIVREQLEKAKRSAKEKSFMRLAGAVAGPIDLSRRKGFSKK